MAPRHGAVRKGYEMSKKVEKKEVCRCEGCGNEAEMTFTCTLPDFDNESAQADEQTSESGMEKKHKVKGTATCEHCGNEADMWIDF